MERAKTLGVRDEVEVAVVVVGREEGKEVVRERKEAKAVNSRVHPRAVAGVAEEKVLLRPLLVPKEVKEGRDEDHDLRCQKEARRRTQV